MSFNFSPKIVTDGLVLYMDAANNSSYISGSTIWYDLSKNNNTGTLVNNPTFSSTNKGNINFDGTDDYVNFGNILNNVFAGTDISYSIDVWFKLPSTLSLNSSYTLVSKYGDSNLSENNRQMLLQVRNLTEWGGTRISFLPSNTLTSPIIARGYRGNSLLSAGIWYNCVMTFNTTIDTNDGLDRVKIYLNTSLETIDLWFNNGTLSDVFPQGNARTSLGAIIGENVLNTPIQLLNGGISNIRIYNRELTSQEVQQNYNTLKTRFGL